jgi:lipoprotein signal peptidase
MRRRRVAAAVAAAVVMIAALVHQALTPTPFHHARAPGVFVLAAVIAAALLVLAPRIPSLGVAIGAGIAAGGALGTLVPGVAWDGVPDPLLRGGIAFNISDVAIAVGDLMLIAAALLYAVRHRGDLRRPA